MLLKSKESFINQLFFSSSMAFGTYQDMLASDKSSRASVNVVDNKSNITLVTLVGGDIDPLVEEILRKALSSYPANLYVYGAEDTSLVEADELRVSTNGFREERLDSLLKKSIGLFVNDTVDSSRKIYISGKNRRLVDTLCRYLGSYEDQAQLIRDPNFGANHSEHPANLFVDGGGAQISIGRGFDKKDTDFRKFATYLIKSAIAQYAGQPEFREKDLVPTSGVHRLAYIARRAVGDFFCQF